MNKKKITLRFHNFVGKFFTKFQSFEMFSLNVDISLNFGQGKAK